MLKVHRTPPPIKNPCYAKDTTLIILAVNSSLHTDLILVRNAATKNVIPDESSQRRVAISR